MTSVIEGPSTNVGRVSHKRNQAKAKRVIFDSMKYHLMPVITPLKTTKEFFNTLVKLYEAKAPSHKRTLKNKLHTLKMQKYDIVSSFTKISQIRDQLITIGVNVDDDDLVQTVVDGLPPSWETFMSGVNTHENQPNFERLWHDTQYS